MTLESLAASLEGGRTAVSLVAEALERAAAAPAVFFALRGEAALAEAAEADARRAAGAALGPLDGIPIGWKDLFDIAGMRTTAGSLARAEAPVATADAPVVAATRSVGLIPLGKTHLNEFAFSGIGYNPHFATPFSDRPGGEGRAPGGSSAGSAVAVQRGIVAGAIGTDTAGSVRIPPAFNGVVGFKTSRGRYPMDGVFGLAESFDTLGPIATSVRDCTWLDAAMRGIARPSFAEAKPLVVFDAAILDEPGVEEAVRANTHAVADRLRQAGVTVEVRPVVAFAAARKALAELGWLGAWEAYTFHKATIAAHRDEIDPRVVKRLEAAASFQPANVAELHRLRPLLIADLTRELAGALMLTPTIKHVAPLLAPLVEDMELFTRTNMATLSLTMPGSYLDTPGIAMPSGTDSDGHPTSVLFSAASGTDNALLAQTLWIERALA